MDKNNRILKVYGMSDNKYNDTTMIMMKGKWLEQFGFKVGKKYHVYCQNGKLVITVDSI